MLRPLRLALGCALTSWLLASSASAAEPARWAVSVERLFGLTHNRSELGASTSFSLLSKVGGTGGYSTPRLGFDYLTPLGLTAGVGGGFQVGEEWSALLAMLRVGYFLRAQPGFELWPRVGVSLLFLDSQGAQYVDGGEGLLVEATTYALTLELPLLFHLSDTLALSLTPHADIYLGQNATVQSNDDASGFASDLAAVHLSQYGAQFGLTLLF